VGGGTDRPEKGTWAGNFGGGKTITNGKGEGLSRKATKTGDKRTSDPEEARSRGGEPMVEVGGDTARICRKVSHTMVHVESKL